MARTNGKAAADPGSLLGLTRRGCWPDEGDAEDRRGCWPDASDLPSGDLRPADAIRKIIRGRWLV